MSARSGGCRGHFTPFKTEKGGKGTRASQYTCTTERSMDDGKKKKKKVFVENHTKRKKNLRKRQNPDWNLLKKTAGYTWIHTEGIATIDDTREHFRGAFSLPILRGLVGMLGLQPFHGRHFPILVGRNTPAPTGVA